MARVPPAGSRVPSDLSESPRGNARRKRLSSWRPAPASPPRGDGSTSTDCEPGATMRPAVRRLLLLLSILLVVSFAVFVTNQTAQLVALADRLHPLAGDLAFWSLLARCLMCLAVPAVLLFQPPPTAQGSSRRCRYRIRAPSPRAAQAASPQRQRVRSEFPMRVLWKLEHPMPGELYQAGKVVAG